MQHLTNESIPDDLGWVITRNGVPSHHGIRRSFVEHILPRLTWRDQDHTYLIRRCRPDDDLSEVNRVTVENRPFIL